MNNLTIKPVNFLGDNLVAAKDENTGRIYTGVGYICKGIGLTEGQIKNEKRKIQEDVVLAKGGRNLILPTKGGNQEALAIELDFLPLWLAKISITPKMQEEQTAVAEKLINYQLKAKDVLAEAFTNNKPQTIEDLIIMQAQSIKNLREQVTEANYNATKAIDSAEETKQEVQAIREAVTLEPNQWRKDTANLINKIATKLGGFEHIKPIRDEAYNLLNNTYGVDIKRRLLNKRKNMALEGCSKSKIEKVNYLDVIAEDKKLINGYINIVGRLAVKHGVA
jgi:P22_AR N-terminal domain